MNREDRAFMTRFGSVIAGLVLFSLGLIALAFFMHGKLTPSANPNREAAKLERIKPIAGVHTSEENVQAAAAEAPAAQSRPSTAAAPEAQAAAAAAQSRPSTAAEPQAEAKAPAGQSQPSSAAEPQAEAKAPAGQSQPSSAAEPQAQQAAAADSVDGEQVYQQACAACHVSGAAGAPRLQPSAWADRLPRGIDTLTSHAINGYNLMPAKGGRSDLSDAEVRAAVEWMVAQVEQ